MDGGDRGLRGARHRFAIWAFTLRSDRDDTQAALDRADATVQDEAAQLSDEERTAAAVEAKEQAFGERFQQRYRAVRKRFVAEGKQVDELQSDVEQKAKELAASVEEATQAEGAVDGLRSRLQARDDEGELAGACARGALSALDAFVDAETLQQGSQRAVSRLEELRADCAKVLRERD